MDTIQDIFGLDADKLMTYQMMARAVLIFFISLALIRISGIRTLGKTSAFDQLTALMLGAIMGRVVVSAQQSFFGSILAACVIMLLHRLVSWATFKSKKAGLIFKGKSVLLFKDGQKLQDNLAKTNITEADILEALRRNVNVSSLEEVKEVYLERSGEMSFIKNNASQQE